MSYQRKTIDTWEFWLNYGQGWELEIIELTRKDMLVNKKAYNEAGYSPKIIKKRQPKEN